MSRLVVHDRATRCIARMDGRLKVHLKSKLEELAWNPNAMGGVISMCGPIARQVRRGPCKDAGVGCLSTRMNLGNRPLSRASNRA